MKKLLIIIILLISFNNVFAKDGLPHNLWDGSNQIPLNSYLPKYIYGNGGSGTTLYIGIAIPYDNGQLYVEQEWQYLKLTFCMNNSPEPDFTFNNNNVVNSSLGQIDTTIPCNIWGTGDGNITFVYATPNDWNLPGYQLPGLNLSLTIKPNVSWNWTAILTKIEWSTDNLYVNDYNNYKDDITNNIIINQNTDIINNIEDINDNINDDSLPNTNDWLDDWTDLLLENNAVNQILYIPVNILNKIKGALTGQCSDVTIPFGLTGGNETLTFNCWKVTDYVGATVGDLITGFVGFYLIYYFALFLWKFYDDFTSMKDTLSLILGNDNALIVRGDNNG